MVRHLAISGDLGTGKSTLARMIAEELGLPCFSTGDFQRELATAIGLSTLQMNEKATDDETLDALIDGEARRLGRESRSTVVFDSRMAWHTVPEAYRVRLVADPHVSAERAYGRSIASEQYDSVASAHESLVRRYSLEMKRFSSTYRVDITRLRNFDLVLDTSDLTLGEAMTTIIESWKLERSGPALGLSARRVIPLLNYPSADVPSRLRIGYCRPFFFALDVGAMLDRVERETVDSWDADLVLEQGEIDKTGLGACELLHEFVPRSWADQLVSGYGLDLRSYYRWRGWS